MKTLMKLWHYLTRPNPSIIDIDERRQSQLLASFIVVVLVPGYMALIIQLFTEGVTTSTSYAWFALFFTSGIYFLNRAGRFRLSAFTFIGFSFSLYFLMPIVVDQFNYLLYSNLLVITAAMILPRYALPLFLAGFAGHIFTGTFFPLVEEINNFTATVLYTILGAAVIVFMNHRSTLEKEHQEELQKANEALRQSEASLEQRVAARTRDLKLASDVSRQITTVLNLEELLPKLVRQTKGTFNLHFVSIFLYQPGTKRLVLAAGTDEAGDRMLEEGIGFHIETRPSLVAKAARDRESVVINDVSQTEFHAQNPLLPETKSEAVFPMLVGDELIGVMGTQSDTVDRFGSDDVEIFNILAEQIAIAVKNAQLYENQTSLAEELRTADRMKSQFLASMSHELRTPLNAIINFSEMIALEMMGPINTDQKGLLDQSLESSQHLLNLINDVLDISKIQAGQLALYVENDVDLHTELKSAVGMVEPIIKGKPVTLVEDVDSDLPPMSADKRRVRQIVLNLLTNAAKFTDEGQITLSVKNQGDHVLLSVSDTGPGITKEMQNVIFEPFLQTEDGIKNAEGTGLGLPIARSLVMAHGGELWLESEPGEGAVFYVRLPINAAETAVHAAAVFSAVPTTVPLSQSRGANGSG